MAKLLSTDPITWYLDPTTNDFPANKLITFTSGNTAVAQGIKTRLLLCAGEWFLDLDAGVPYLERPGVTAQQALYGQKFDQNKTQIIFRDAILGCPGVGSISAISCVFNNATRTLTVAWAVVTSFGDTVKDSLSVTH